MPKTKNQEQNHRMEKIEEHIAVINDELNDVKISLATIKTIVLRHDKVLWLIVGGVIAVLFKLF